MHYIDTLHAEVENWKNKYDLAMVCYKDEETTHTATLARLVKAQEQNAELLAALEAGYNDLRTRLIHHAQGSFNASYDEATVYADRAVPVLQQMHDAIAKAKGENNQ